MTDRPPQKEDASKALPTTELQQGVLGQFVRHSPGAHAIFDRSMICLACSDQFLLDFKISEEQLVGNSLYDALPQIPKRWRDAHQRALRGNIEQNDNDSFERADETLCYVQWKCLPWHDEQNEIGGIIVYSEVTPESPNALREAKEKAEEQNAELQAILDNATNGISVFSASGEYVYRNDASAQIYGYKSAEDAARTETELGRDYLLKMSTYETYPDGNPLSADAWPSNRVLNGEHLKNVYYSFRRKDIGLKRIMSVSGSPIHNAAGDIVMAVLATEDITKREAAELALRENEERLKTLLAYASDAIHILDMSGNVIECNFAFANYLGYTYEEALSLNVKDWETSPLDEGQILAMHEFHKEPKAFEARHRRKDGTIFPVEVNTKGIYLRGEPVLYCSARDITKRKNREEEKRRMAERLEQTQRLESLGVLAGGIAHDFNNLLMVILGHADLALMDVPSRSPTAENLEQIKFSSQRAADLCTQLLAYSGQGKIKHKTFSINILIDEMTQILGTSISKKCALKLRLDKHLPMTEGDPSQIQQIIMNFVTNASEAIGDQNGEITVSTGTIEYSQVHSESNYVVKPLQPGRFVTLEVSDNGHGMSKETIGRIFEPFFTTKFTGRGLGLSAVLGIIQSHGGGLWLYSEPNQGTVFKALFPIAEDESNESLRSDAEKTTIKRNFSGTVLLVDDEESVRTVCADQLKALGLRVITAEDGREGRAVYQKNQNEIDLVILDLSMPEMSGEEVFHELRALNPDVKIVLTSGYSETDVTTRFTGKNLSAFLRKPYTLKELALTLSGLLPEK